MNGLLTPAASYYYSACENSDNETIRLYPLNASSIESFSIREKIASLATPTSKNCSPEVRHSRVVPKTTP